MQFKRIQIKKWQQFENIEVNFHDRLTVLTGANGSGKTTILNLLGRHFGWDSHPMAVPKKDVVSKIWKWVAGLWSTENTEDNLTSIGEIEYSNGTVAKLSVPDNAGVQYSVHINGQQGLNGFFVPSHRSIFRYQHIDTIPTTNSTTNKLQAFHKISNSNKNRYFGSNDKSSSFYMKETLISWNIFGKGNDSMEPSEKLTEYYNEFENILKIVLPKDLGFNRFVIKNFEVVLECNSGDFLIDAASGGISAVIDMAWQVFMFSTHDENISEKSTVLIDEIENHLHPTMQRRILPDLVKAFPSVTFIVSTHSPLIIGSVKDSAVFAFRYNENRKIVSEKLDLLNKAKTASEVLDEVLGVSFTMPVWAEDGLKSITNKYSDTDLSEAQVFEKIRSDLKELGLERLMPEAITELIEKDNDKNN